MLSTAVLTLALAGSALSGTILWDGRFNDLSSSSDLLNWSWSNEVGPYQYYIHGSGPITEYVNLSPSYKNPADTSSKQGVKITIDSTSYWNGQNMRRTELIPQTTAKINQGKVFYHFSVSRNSANPPSTTLEHQVNFFESHFTELKYGLLSGESGAGSVTSDPYLRWMVNQVSKWNTTFDVGVWHNMAYEIDFSANTVGFWHSTGSSPLVQTVAPISVSTSSNGADWHLGVLRLPMSSSLTSPDVEDWLFSGVYIESGPITTAVAAPGGVSVTSTPGSGGPTTTTTTTTTKPTSTPPTTTSTPPTSTPAGSIPKYGQCGGTNWTGSGTCASGSTCTAVSPPYYYQCL